MIDGWPETIKDVMDSAANHFNKDPEQDEPYEITIYSNFVGDYHF